MTNAVKRIGLSLMVLVLAGLAGCASDRPAEGSAAPDPGRPGETYDQDTILDEAKGFFGGATQGLAKVVHKVFSDHGEPDAYIAGEEGSGALVVGARYGGGWLHRKGHRPMRVYWQGPSVGLDTGGNASKVFVLVYGLGNAEALFQRFPGVEGSYYFVAGVGVNYQRDGDIVLAPIRTGVGLRAGVNVGYLNYTRQRTWIPF